MLKKWAEGVNEPYELFNNKSSKFDWGLFMFQIFLKIF